MFSREITSRIANSLQGGRDPALMLALNAGMRDAEIRNLTWEQIHFDEKFLTVGKSKTTAGEGRTIPLNPGLLEALTEHSKWYLGRFGNVRPDWPVSLRQVE